jgi:type IV pilus assembly protein PilY1
MRTNYILALFTLALLGYFPTAGKAQTVPPASCTSSAVSENFTAGTTNCTWNFYGGACLTAGSSTNTVSPGPLPMCANYAYYGSQTQVGGNSGNLNTTPDTPTTGGALRLTNSGNNQSGAIVSNVPFSLGASGLQVTFTTETYIGDSGNNGANGDSDGADGISFFLQDASVPVSLGDYGGSLGYTCSNSNGSSPQGYDGMIGAYVGLGIDEYGNFLDGSNISNAANTSSTFSAGEDNTSTGYGKVANRVGLRGAGSTAWSYLNTSPATAMYYPSSLTADQRNIAVQQACRTGYVWDYRNPSGAQISGKVTNSVPNVYNALPVTTIKLPNYGAIPSAYAILPSNRKIAKELATYRGYATSNDSASTDPTIAARYGNPITYNLSITTGGLLSLSYSYNGTNFQPVITGQNITNSNGPLPANVRFGFAASTGGSRNIHEIMCFQALPQNSAQSSAGLNQKQTAKVQTGTQVYFAYYNSNNWTGALTSQYLDSPDGNPNNLQIDPAVNWDASCVLSGVASGAKCPSTGANGPISPPNPDSGRVLLSWNGTSGVPFTSTGITAADLALLNSYDPSPQGNSGTAFPPLATSRLEYLRGVRTDEQTAAGLDANMPNSINPSGFRARSSVLGDIVDSSPTWVGAPSAPYANTWADLLHPTATIPENAGTNTYAAFVSANASRMNVVYAGANDGFMHGFETGLFNSTGTFVGTNNDGKELLAFMPKYVVDTINSATVPASSPAAPNVALDFSSPQYAHRFNVDGTPGTGEVFYNGAWHTWLVSGLGAGGNAFFALDITNPTNFSQGNAGAIVIGEWSTTIQTISTADSSGNITTTVTGGHPSTAPFTCISNSQNTSANSDCANSLGRNFGTPQIRRFHNNPIQSGQATTSWGAVFGNGSGSYNGDAGIFIMMANNTGAPTLYYLSTNVGSRTGTPNGIYFVTPADLDGDHTVDYIYAGDLQGNIWRFDVTSADPTKWAVTSASGVANTSASAGVPIYSTSATAGAAFPITTKLVVASVASTPNPHVLVEFGTGQQTPFTNNSQATYATSQQYLVGVWDWNLKGWNLVSNAKYAALSSTTTPIAPTSKLVGFASLQVQTIMGTFDANSQPSTPGSTSPTNYYYRTLSNNTVCYADSTGCTTPVFGWYLALTSGFGNPFDANGLQATGTYSGAPQLFEQVLFSPTLQAGAFIVNTTIPPTTSLATCSSTLAGGWTMAINPATGGAFSTSFFGDSNHNFLNIGTSAVSGIGLSGTGSASVVLAGTNTYLVTQTVSGTGAIVQINPPGGQKGSRLTWIQRR